MGASVFIAVGDTVTSRPATWREQIHSWLLRKIIGKTQVAANLRIEDGALCFDKPYSLIYNCEIRGKA